MADRLIRVLLVGANDVTYRITCDVLADIPHNTFAVDAVEAHITAFEAIKHTPYDICFVSNPLGTSSCLDFLRQVETLNIALPTLVLTEPDDEAVGIDARRAGAVDYVLMTHLSAPLLERVIRYAMEYRRTLDALKLAQDAAETAQQVKNEFLSMMSHEMRTPINTVIGTAELLSETHLTDEQRAYADTIRTSSQLLGGLIANITDYSKYETGHMRLARVAFDIRTILEHVIELFAEQAHLKGVELYSHVYDEVPPIVLGDPGQLRQLLLNLIGNAVKFTDTGEVVVQAMLDEKNHHDILLCFEVTDTGIGIPLESHSLLFQHFVQGDSSIRRKHNGTGLGLALCKQIATVMGGSISLNSEPGKGSTFWCTVRLALPPTTLQAPRPQLIQPSLPAC